MVSLLVLGQGRGGAMLTPKRGQEEFGFALKGPENEWFCRESLGRL